MKTKLVGVAHVQNVGMPKFTEVIWLSNPKVHTIITAMKSVIALFGSPEQLISE